MALKFIDEIDLNGKRVIGRFDFNVPLSKDGQAEIKDSTRIDLALQTIKYILDNGASKLILMSHLGRPKGEIKKELSLEPVAHYLAKELNEEVVLTESCIDEGIKNILDLNKERIILLENLRFHKEETANDRDFAKTLSTYADVYVNDAFGTAHRKHASTYEINAYFKQSAVGGFLLRKEIEALSKVTEKPEKPFMGIIGGAKVSDKIKTIERLLVNVEHLFIGGAMAYPFLKAKGHQIGKSLCSDEDVALAKQILNSDRNNKIVLPIDHSISASPEETPSYVNSPDIPEQMMGLDIGPETLRLFESKLKSARTIFWNGPMGLFENKDYATGTLQLSQVISELDAFSLVGGGDSVSAVKLSGLSDKFSHISTGGGASLEFIENGGLPGIQALKFGID